MDRPEAIDAVSDRYRPARWLPTGRGAWLNLIVGATFVFVACTGGSNDTDDRASRDQPTDNGSATESRDTGPDFELALFKTDNHLQNELIRLSQFQGNPVVVNFWFPSCPPCRAEMPDFEAAFQKYGTEGVKFIGVQLVGLDTAQDGQDFVDRIGVNYALGADETGDIFKDYQVIGFPTTVFLDKDHGIVQNWTGALNAEKLEEFILELLD